MKSDPCFNRRLSTFNMISTSILKIKQAIVAAKKKKYARMFPELVNQNPMETLKIKKMITNKSL